MIQSSSTNKSSINVKNTLLRHYLLPPTLLSLVAIETHCYWLPFRLHFVEYQNRWHLLNKIPYLLWVERNWCFHSNIKTVQVEGEHQTLIAACKFVTSSDFNSFSMTTQNGFPTKSLVIIRTYWSRTQRWCLAGETGTDDEFTWPECVSKNLIDNCLLDSQLFDLNELLLYLAQAGNLNLMDLAQLDDLWMEAMLNEIETIENGIVVLVDMSG